MFFRTFIIGLLLVCFFALTNASSGNNASSQITIASKVAVMECQGCTYERKFIEGVWYIIVYGPDGSIIDIYPDVDE